ncbi:MAG TPA: nucleotidyltransferase domain-containing protein [Micromonosporaceae bacterium]
MLAGAPFTEHGDRGVARGGEILRTVVGSGVHGIAIEGTDDHDEMGVFIEPPELVIGLGSPVDHYVFRTQPEGARSGPGDTDLVLYSLRRYLRLATKGNPTALLPLFAPAGAVLVLTPIGEQLRALGPSMLSQLAVRRFLGYLDGQVDRLLGRGRRGGVPNRPELVARYGYDVKYASHALRLAYQGLELARDGRLTLPMPEPERERVLRVKRGDVADRGLVLTEIHDVRDQVAQVLESGSSPLSAEPDFNAISAWSVHAHRRHWGWVAPA